MVHTFSRTLCDKALSAINKLVGGSKVLFRYQADATIQGRHPPSELIKLSTDDHQNVSLMERQLVTSRPTSAAIPARVVHVGVVLG